jgi:hypothetical protein
VQVHYGEGVASRTGPEPCAGAREGERRSVGRGAHRPAIEPRKLESIRVPTCSDSRKATWTGASTQALARPGVVEDPGMCGSSLFGNRTSYQWSRMN